MKEENLSGEQREKTIEQAMRAIWCERGNRIERNRISEIEGIQVPMEKGTKTGREGKRWAGSKGRQGQPTQPVIYLVHNFEMYVTKR